MKIYLFFILLFSSTICFAQTVIGTYRYKSDDFPQRRTITFTENSFKEEIGSDLTTKIGAGVYDIKNNQLILKYQIVSNQDTSTYEMSTSNKSNSSSIINLKVFDINGIPLVATYGCRDNKDNPLSLSYTDNNGTGNIIIYNNSSIGYFTIDCIGYYRISLPIKTIMGKITNIIAHLRPQTKSYIEPQTIKYKISEINTVKLVLRENNNTLIFEKID